MSSKPEANPEVGAVDGLIAPKGGTGGKELSFGRG